MPGEWYTPIDPDCPDNPMNKFYDDPYVSSGYVPSDVVADFDRDLSRKHMAKCKRCQEYGVENIDVVYN